MTTEHQNKMDIDDDDGSNVLWNKYYIAVGLRRVFTVLCRNTVRFQLFSFVWLTLQDSNRKRDYAFSPNVVNTVAATRWRGRLRENIIILMSFNVRRTHKCDASIIFSLLFVASCVVWGRGRTRRHNNIIFLVVSTTGKYTHTLDLILRSIRMISTHWVCVFPLWNIVLNAEKGD